MDKYKKNVHMVIRKVIFNGNYFNEKQNYCFFPLSLAVADFFSFSSKSVHFSLSTTVHVGLS